PDSGRIVADGTQITYDGLEPVNVSAPILVINGADLGGTTEVLDKDVLKVGACPNQDSSLPFSSPACPAGSIFVQNYEGPFALATIAEVHYFQIAGTTSVTINGGLGTDTVEFISDYIVPGSNLTVNAETIKVDAGVTVNVGTGSLTFNATTNDNG